MPDEKAQLVTEGAAVVVRVPGGTWTPREVGHLDTILAELAEAELGGQPRHLVTLVEAQSADFCVGADPTLYGRDTGVDPAARLADLSRPTVAVLTGRCRSAGLAMALAADLRVAGPEASFDLDELSGGRFPLWGAIQRLTRVVGPGPAAHMVLLGARLDAEEARRVGLVHEVDDHPRQRARELADLLARRGPLALEYAKEAITRGSELPLHHALRLEADFNHLLQTSRDRAEGLAAFFEKREPTFEGR